MSKSERKLYKVLRYVGIKRQFIKSASSLEDLYLDEFDFKLLVYYFETEFNVRLQENEIRNLTTLPAFYQYVNRKHI